MTSIREQTRTECEKYIIQAEVNQKRKLNRQKKKNIAEIEKVEKKIKAVKFKDSEYNIKLELIGKMKKYVEKYAFLPRSYHNMLIQWSN